MRLFLAIELPETLRDDVQKILTSIRSSVDALAQVRWVRPTQFHLTLKFLGECPSSRVAALEAAMREVANGFSCFSAQFQGLGCFPSAGRPRVIWLGMPVGETETCLLAGKTEVACAALGFLTENRKFNAHLTLARVKEVGKPAPLHAFLTNTKTPAIGPLEVRSVSLIESRLSSSGALYKTLASFPLRTPLPLS